MLIKPTRRAFIGGASLAIASPAIVRAAGWLPLVKSGATVLHLTDPNHFAAGSSWSAINAVGSNNANTAPDFTNTAGEITSLTSSGFAAMRATIPITMVSGTLYSLTGYVKNNVVPVWLKVRILDSLASPVSQACCWVDTTANAGAAGTTQTVGTVVDSFAVTVSTNNYNKVVFNFHFNTTPAADNFIDLEFCDSNGGTTPTTSQDFLVWGWGA